MITFHCPYPIDRLHNGRWLALLKADANHLIKSAFSPSRAADRGQFMTLCPPCADDAQSSPKLLKAEIDSCKLALEDPGTIHAAAMPSAPTMMARADWEG